jgi:hypothetical protein
MLRIDSLSQKSGSGGDASALQTKQAQLKELKAIAERLKLQQKPAVFYSSVAPDPDEELEQDEIDGEGDVKEESGVVEKRRKDPVNALNALRDFESQIDSFVADFTKLDLVVPDNESVSLRKKLQESFSAGPPSYDGPTCVKCKRPASSQEMKDFGNICSLCRQDDLLISPAQARRYASSLPPHVAPSSDPATAQLSVQSTSSKRGKKIAAEPLPAEIEQYIHQPSGMPDHLDDEEFSEVLDRKITDLNTRITNHEEITEKIEERLAKLEKRLQESEATIKKLKAIQAKKAPIEQASP